MALSYLPQDRPGIARRALQGLGLIVPTCTAELFVGFGIQHKFSAEAVIDPAAAESTVREIVGRYYPNGASYVRTRGRYKDDRHGGRMVEEPGMRVTLEAPIFPGTDPDAFRLEQFVRARCCAASIRHALGQRTIMVTFRDEHGRGLLEFLSNRPKGAGVKEACKVSPADRRQIRSLATRSAYAVGRTPPPPRPKKPRAKKKSK